MPSCRPCHVVLKIPETNPSLNTADPCWNSVWGLVAHDLEGGGGGGGGLAVEDRLNRGRCKIYLIRLSKTNEN